MVDHIKYFTCPYSGKIMLYPVIASDGMTYDFISFTNIVLKHNSISPITNIKLTKMSCLNHLMKQMIYEKIEQSDIFDDYILSLSLTDILLNRSYSYLKNIKNFFSDLTKFKNDPAFLMFLISNNLFDKNKHIEFITNENINWHNEFYEYNRSVLQHTVCSQKYDVALLLLDYVDMIDIDHKDNKQNILFTYICDDHEMQILRKFINNFGNKINMNHITSNNVTILEYVLSDYKKNLTYEIIKSSNPIIEFTESIASKLYDIIDNYYIYNDCYNVIIIDILKKQPKYVNHIHANRRASTMLAKSIFEKNYNLIDQLLLLPNIDVTLCENIEWSPICIAIRHQMGPIVNKILNHSSFKYTKLNCDSISLMSIKHVDDDFLCQHILSCQQLLSYIDLFNIKILYLSGFNKQSFSKSIEYILRNKSFTTSEYKSIFELIPKILAIEIIYLHNLNIDDFPNIDDSTNIDNTIHSNKKIRLE